MNEQERLAQLKREQTEADAARDSAWRQLKSVVQEVRSACAHLSKLYFDTIYFIFRRMYPDMEPSDLPHDSHSCNFLV